MEENSDDCQSLSSISSESKEVEVAKFGEDRYDELLNKWRQNRWKDCVKDFPRQLSRCTICDKVFTTKLYKRHVTIHSNRDLKKARLKPGNS